MIDSWSPRMKDAMLASLVAVALAAVPSYAGEPVVVVTDGAPIAFSDHAAYWRQWAQDFSHELTHELTRELGALYSPRVGAGKVVKGAPYSAELITETRQMLADGNEISRKKTGAVFRDGEGRTRQETGPDPMNRTVFISDPVGNANVVLSPKSKRAVTVPSRPMSYKYDSSHKQAVRVGPSEVRVEDGKVFIDGKQVQGSGRVEVARGGKTIVVDGGNITIDGKPLGEAQGSRHVIVRSVETTDGKHHEEVNVPVPPAPPVPHTPGYAPLPPVPPVPPLPGITTMRFESTAKLGKGVTTSLGTKEFEGVKAEGKSTTWTIAAGEIGNRNPITVMSETWYSPDLQVTVYSRHSDPRTGESIYRLANIRRGEPAADLFKVPDDYNVKKRAPKG
jgi:hypothetical protein